MLVLDAKTDGEIKNHEYSDYDKWPLVCGVDFCDECGDCIECYGDDPCFPDACGHLLVRYVGGTHDHAEMVRKHNEEHP